MTPLTLRPIKRLLVVNRGEIAVRILHAARELSAEIETFAIYTAEDRSHCDLGRPHNAIQVSSPAAYLDIPQLVSLARQHSIDTVHPGYGFLSESADFAHRMWHEAGAMVVGPGWETLARTGDKLQAKRLAKQLNVPVLDATDQPTSDIQEIRAFAAMVGYPVMIKAVDGGGGRGIRLAFDDKELDNAVNRAIGESPSHSVFVEKAAIDRFHHVEVQVIGDGTGQVRHLWERNCSVQRRFQKIVEYAPSLLENRKLVSKVIDSALKIASAIKYLSLGTFEFLVSSKRPEFYFLEINPRLQVEHTITECITGADLVQMQLLLTQGFPLHQLGLQAECSAEADPPGKSFSIQLRLCAEDPKNDFSLSVGRVTEFSVAGGPGVRVDTNIDMSGSSSMVVGAHFDNLLAKIIVTGPSWGAAVRKAQRVLSDTRISGVKTNLELLRGIVAHQDFASGRTDTQWLGANLDPVLSLGESVSASLKNASFPTTAGLPVPQQAMPLSNLLFRRGDAWTITLEPLQESSSGRQEKISHHLQLSRVLRNDFPSSMAAEIEYTIPSSQSTTSYRLQLTATNTAASALLSSSHRQGDLTNSRHVILPISGKLVEVLVSEGDDIKENQVVAFVKQMKMELEVRSPHAGRVKWAYEMEDEEEDVAEGILLAELEEKVEVRGKL